MAISLRPLDKSDIPALARLYEACEAVDDTGEHYSEADWAEELSNPDIELGLDVVGAFEGKELVGYFSVGARKDQAHRKAYGSGMTLPSRRGEGIGTLLAGAMVARASQIQESGDGPLRLMLGGLISNQSQADLLAAVGMTPERWSFTMRTALAAVPAPPRLPDGFAVRRYRSDDADRLLAAHNIAFRDYPNFSVWTSSEWQQWVVGSRSFRPDLSLLVTPDAEPERIVAYAQTNEYDAYQAATGKREAFLAKIGTLPEQRGKGLASILLRHCLATYREAGYDEAALDVDSMNPTGALGIYERAGFTTERRFASYSRVLG